jgi:hypothetical protein
MSFEKHSTSDVDQNNIVQGARQRAPSFKTVGSPGEEGFTAEKQLEGRHKGGAKDDAKAGGKGGKGAKRDAPKSNALKSTDVRKKGGGGKKDGGDKKAHGGGKKGGGGEQAAGSKKGGGGEEAAGDKKAGHKLKAKATAKEPAHGVYHPAPPHTM